MKFNFKKVLAGTLTALVLIPSLAFAESDNSNRGNRGMERKEDKSGANFCTRISFIEEKLADQVTRAETKQSKYQMDRLSKMEKKESDIDGKRALGRGDADSKRVKNWDKMIRKAKTDAEIAAVSAYKTAISTAVTTRRTAVDTAVKAYRDGLSTILGTNNTALDQAVATFKASINSALAKAKTDCTAGVDSKTVKDTYNKSMSDAKKALETARKNAMTNEAITALKKTRNDAINLAATNFKTATDKARADLLLVLKK